jgi:hypothetical protein
MGHSKIETTKNIYGHLFAQDRTSILDAMNQAVSRLHAYDESGDGEAGSENSVRQSEWAKRALRRSSRPVVITTTLGQQLGGLGSGSPDGLA